MRFWQHRGFALATTFVVAFMVLLAGFTMAGLASFNYNLARQALLREEAFNGAEAGLNYAIGMLIQNAKWGSYQPDNTMDVLPATSMTGPGPLPTDPVSFYVSFSQNPTAHKDYPTDLPFSVNNFSGSTSADGPIDPDTGVARQVPPGTCLIFVEAVAGQGSMVQTRIIEALLQAPAYPYVLAARNSVATWDDLSGFWSKDADRASLVDGQTCQDAGNIFVGPPKGKCPLAGWCWDSKGCVKGQYGVYLSPGSLVTGSVRNTGNTNVVQVCPGPCDKCFPKSPCQFACRPPQAACVSAPTRCQHLPSLETVARVCVTYYSWPCTYKLKGSSPASGACCSGYQWYSQCTCGQPGFVPCQCGHVVINGDTLIVPPTGGTVTLGSLHSPVIFTDNYTLTVLGTLMLKGGIAGPKIKNPGKCCPPYQTPTATLLILPVPLPAKCQPLVPPCGNKYSEIFLWPCRSAGIVGNSGVSVLATGNVIMQPPWGASACKLASTPDNPVCGWFTLNGMISVLGNIGFSLGSIHVNGLIVATNPWCCGTVWGNIFVNNGIWASYSPSLARTSWIGREVASAQPRNGVTVAYWREVRPAP